MTGTAAGAGPELSIAALRQSRPAQSVRLPVTGRRMRGLRQSGAPASPGASTQHAVSPAARQLRFDERGHRRVDVAKVDATIDRVAGAIRCWTGPPLRWA
jgi:hypothetical protein